jgi:hypothetical protein
LRAGKNFFLSVANAFKNLGSKEIVLKIVNHAAKMGGIRQTFSDLLSILPRCG